MSLSQDLASTEFILDEVAAELGITYEAYKGAHAKIAAKYNVNIKTLVEIAVPEHQWHRRSDYTIDRLVETKATSSEAIEGGSRMAQAFAEDRNQGTLSGDSWFNSLVNSIQTALNDDASIETSI
ncbi:MAG: hypothetical protein HRT81_12800 [Henriciella sp.]|nr:hypothetical protein [Henriciella sp.]